jgi:hypothetical protein
VTFGTTDFKILDQFSGMLETMVQRRFIHVFVDILKLNGQKHGVYRTHNQ